MAVVPIAATLATLGLTSSPVLSAVLGVLSIGVGGYFLSVQVANAGRSKEGQLFTDWGGAPTTQLLRIGGQAASEAQRKIWRKAVQGLTGVKLAGLEAEKADPLAADDQIEAAVGQIRYLGQESRYPLVGRENAQYGLERNLWGFRWFGRIIALVCLVVLVVVLDLGHLALSALLVVGLVVDLAMSVVWFTVPSADRAKAAGFRYGHQLLHAAVRESKSNTRGAGKKGKK